MRDWNRRTWIASMSNARGRLFEDMVKGGCRYYKDRGRAKIEKMPEPFRVIDKDRCNGIATIRFTAHAQPDFIGCLAGGTCIAFEAKYTDTEKLSSRVLTKTQAAALQEYYEHGAMAAVCAGIQDKFFMLPWGVFANMKAWYGRQYVRAEDIAEFEIKFNGVALFLDYKNGRKVLPNEIFIKARAGNVSESDTKAAGQPGKYGPERQMTAPPGRGIEDKRGHMV